MKISVTRQTATRYIFTGLDELDNIIFSQQINPQSPSGQDRLEQLTKVSATKILNDIRHIVVDNQTDTINVTPDNEFAGPFRVFVRPKQVSKDAVEVIVENDPEVALKKAFEFFPKFPREFEVIVQWDQIVRLASLDIDYHSFPYELRPNHDDLLQIMMQIQPKPVCYHVSHGRGMKLYYVAARGFEANELAACAALNWLSLDGRATAEIKCVTRHPLYQRGPQKCGELYWGGANTDLSEISKWLGKSTDENALNEWLETSGFQLGARYDHKYCPIDPHHASHGDPVFVTESGIFCHSCEGTGKQYGNCRKPGWVPWNYILGGVDSRVGIMLRKCCHWTHGKHHLLHLYPGMKEDVLRLAYSSAIKMLHGVDCPLLPAVFTDKVLIRFPGRWMLDGVTNLQRDLSRDLLGLLPCVQYANRVGKIIVNSGDLAELRHGDNDLGKYGIFDLKPIRGMKIWGQFLNYSDDSVPYLTYNKDIPSDRQPKYVHPSERVDICRAWETLEKVYPGVNRRYIELLIASKGVCEGGIDQPMLAVAGPGGAGKTFSVDIAASICGDAAGDVPWTANTERLRQSIMGELDKGNYIRIDELFKSGEREKRTPREALDPILNFTSNSVSHKMYVGPVRLGQKFTLVITDILTPGEIQRDIQLARRLMYVRLNNRVPDWRKTSVAHGITENVSFRSRSKEFAQCADAILSDVIDRYFRSVTYWDDIASDLGFYKLEHSPDFDNPRDLLERLYLEVCTSKEDTKLPSYPYNKGWRRVTRDFTEKDLLSETWNELSDGGGEKWQQSRRCAEVDWSQILKVESDVHLDIRKHKNSVLLLRFRVGDYENPTAVNDQIKRT